MTTWAEFLPRGCTVGSQLPEPLPTGRSVHRDQKQWGFTKAWAHDLRPNHHCTGGNRAQRSQVLAMEPSTRGPMANPRLCHPRSTQRPNPGPSSSPLVARADSSLPHRDTCDTGPLGRPGRCSVDITAGGSRGPSPDSTQGSIMEFAPTLGRPSSSARGSRVSFSWLEPPARHQPHPPSPSSSTRNSLSLVTQESTSNPSSGPCPLSSQL